MATESRFVNLNSIIEDELTGKWNVEYSSKMHVTNEPNKRLFMYRITARDAYQDIMDAVRKIYSIALGEGFGVESIYVSEILSHEPSVSIHIVDKKQAEVSA